MKRTRQFGIAVLLGAGAAGLSVLLPAVVTLDITQMGRFLPYTLMIALPLGAIAGVLCLALGLLTYRILLRTGRPRIASVGASVAVFLFGAAVSALIFLGPARDLWPYGAIPLIVTALGAAGLYLLTAKGTPGDY